MPCLYLQRAWHKYPGYSLLYITVSSFTPSDGQPSSCMFPSLPFTSRHQTHHRPVIYIHHYVSFYRLPIRYSFSAMPEDRMDTRCCQAPQRPVFRSSPGVLRHRASVRGRVLHAVTHCLSATSTVHPSPRLSIHSGLWSQTAGSLATSAAFYRL